MSLHKLLVYAALAAPPLTIARATSPLPVIWQGNPPASPEIHGAGAVGFYTGTPVFWTIPATGNAPIRYSANQLPHGLSLDPSTGTITGTLSEPGNYQFTVVAKNRAGDASRTISFVAGDTVALTPPMGWNSYDAYGDDVTESETLANAKYVHDKLLPYGWDTVTADYRWYDPGASTAPNNPNARAGVQLTMDGSGRLLPAVNRFPSAADGKGFTALAVQIHAMGLKFGIHIMRGIPRIAVQQNLPIDGSSYTAAEAANTADTCPWCPDMYGVKGDTPAGQAYYDSLFRLYASWGVDFVKMDDTSQPYHADEITAVRSAIGKCGRSIVYSLSPGETPVVDALHVADHSNMWRMSGDFWDNWRSLNHSFELDYRWEGIGGPGHWPDSDMLPVGHLSVDGRSVGPNRETRFTLPEQMTLISLWCLQPAPLMVGADLPDNDQWTLSLLTNPEVLALDQDPVTSGAVRVKSSDGMEIWSRNLSDGSLAVGIFNRAQADSQVTVHWSDLRLFGSQTVRDLWLRKNLGTFHDQITLPVLSHGVVLLRLTES